MKNVYLLVPDLHLNLNKEHRKNYLSEVVQAIQQILGLREKYASMGYSVNLILMGDVVDRSFDDTDTGLTIQGILEFFCSRFDKVDSVVGNHELTYFKSNPFWFLVSEIGDPVLSQVAVGFQPKGLRSVIHIPAIIEDGDVTFYFNHYKTPPKVPVRKTANSVAIGLFHQQVGSNDICKMWGTFDNVEEAAYIQQYNQVYFGHMHMAFGDYWLDDKESVKGTWLGSLGRTNVTEVTETECTRNVPAIIVEDGRYVKREDNIISLPSAEDCVNLKTYEAAAAARRVVKERKESVDSVSFASSLYSEIESNAVRAGVEGMLRLCEGHSGDITQRYDKMIERGSVE